MKNLPLVSEAVQDRYARAQFEYKRAMEELLASWQALVRERYAREERERYAREQGPPDAEEDCSDLG